MKIRNFGIVFILFVGVGFLSLAARAHAAGCSNTSLGGGVTCKASASGSNTSGSNLASLSTASTLNVTTGDTLVAAIRYESGCFTTYPQSLFITDTAGNYFQLATSTTGGGGSWCIASYYAPGVIGNASDTVTVYFNTAQAYPAIIVHDLSGLAVTSATSTLDQVALGTAASASSVSTAPFTTTQSTEYLFAAGAVNNTGVSFTAGPGYTDVTTDSGGMISTEQDLVTTIKSAATSSMSAGGTNPWGITAMTLVAGSAPTGSGIPTGHGVVVWGATGYTSSQCGAPSCIMKVTDSAGNTYTTEQTIDDPGANIDEFLAVGPVTSAIAGDGSGWVKCSFYDNNGTTPIPGGAIYCRVFDDSNMASTGSVDSSNNNGENAGALTVTGGNTDLAFAVYDLEATGLTATPGSGYTSIIPALLDGEGGMQYAEYEEVTAGTTPTASYSPSNPAGWGLDAALKETTSGGTISYVGGVLAPTNQTSTIIQVPGYYGVDHTPPSVTWISPANDATVSSITTLTVSSTDNVAVSSTAFYVGSYGATLASSTLIGSTSTASGTLYSLSWNTASSTNGSTTLWALATDTSNNTSTASTTVNVENVAAGLVRRKLLGHGITR